MDISGTSGIIPPTMKTIEELLDLSYENTGGKKGLMLNAVERNFILKKVIRSLKIEHWSDLPFLKFLAIGKRMLHLFDELSKERVDFEHIEQLVQIGHYPEKFVKHEISIIKDIYNEYRRTIKAMGYQDIIDKCEMLFDHFNTSSLESYNYICITGLVATTRLENSLIKCILNNLNAELIIHSSITDLKYSVDPTDPYYLHIKMLNSFAITEFERIEVIGAGDSRQPVINIAGTKSISHQVLHIKDVLHRLRDRYEPHRIAVVLTDERCVLPIINVLNSSGLNYNLSTGLPLTQSPIFAFIKQLLDVIESGFHYREFFIFLKHPLNKNAVIDGKSMRPLIYELERKLIEKRMNYFHFEEHNTDELRPLNELLKKIFNTVTQITSLQKYITNLTETLNDIICYNNEFIKTGAESIGNFFDHLDNLGKLRMISEYTEPGIKMLRFILDTLKDETFRTRGDPMKGIQLIGILEARCLDFDCIILPSMNEGIFPKRSDKDLFVNQQLRKEIHLPYDKERDSLFHFYFSEMVNGKKEVYLSYIEEEKRDIRSRFVDFQIDKGARVNEVGIKISSSLRSLKQRTVIKSSDLFKKLIRRLTTRGLSPTNLKTYRECSYRFYLKYLLGVKEPEVIVEEADYLEWGRILHRALCDFYKYDTPDGLIAEDLKVLKTKLHHRLENALRKELAQYPKMVNFLDLEVYKKRMDRFLQWESERAKSGYVVLTDKIEEKVSSFLQVNNVRVKLYGYPDRIEREDDRYNILDYKTTIPSRKKFELGDEFVEFQLPLYGLIVSNEDFSLINDLAYYGISRDIRICSLTDKSNVAEYLLSFKTKILQPLIEELLSPDIAFCQAGTKNACKYCAFVQLCGVTNV